MQNESILTESTSVSVWYRGLGWVWLQMDTREIWGALEMFYILTAVSTHTTCEYINLTNWMFKIGTFFFMFITPQ